MKPMNCTDLEAVAEELALGLLTGEERAAALAHLESCPSCRAEVASLSALADELVLLAPSVEPPPGFDGVVLGRLAREGAVAEATLPTPPVVPAASATVTPLRPSRRTERRQALRAVAAIVAVLAFLGVLLFGMGNSAAVAMATMRTPAGREVGEAYWRGGNTSSVVVDVPKWSATAASWGPSSNYELVVTTYSGAIKRFPIHTNRSDPWRFDLGSDVRARRVAIVDDSGKLWCAGHFEPALASSWPDR